MLRLYLDEDAMSAALAGSPRRNGIDVATVADVRMRGHCDAEQLAFATANGRAILSHNVGDFVRIHT